MVNHLKVTVRFKSMNPWYNICMYWTNFWQPTVYVQQNIFEKILIEVCSPYLYASFGTFCAIIRGTVSLWSTYVWKSTNSCYLKCRPFRNSSEFDPNNWHLLRSNCMVNYLRHSKSLKNVWKSMISKENFLDFGFLTNV